MSIPLSPRARDFLTENGRAVVSTFRRDGSAQLSIVFCGYYAGTVAFTTTQDRAKIPNLKRDPRCSLLVSAPEWQPYLVLEGEAKLLGPDNTPQVELLKVLRDVYRAAAHQEHPNWAEYDAVMVKDRRWAVFLQPNRIYGPAA